MDPKPIDTAIRTALVQAISECLISEAHPQVAFIADYLDKLRSEWMPRDQELLVHEERHNWTPPSLEYLCKTLEAQHMTRDLYIKNCLLSLSRFQPPLSYISNPDIVYCKIVYGSSQIEVPVDPSRVPDTVLNLFRTVTRHLNHLTVYNISVLSDSFRVY